MGYLEKCLELLSRHSPRECQVSLQAGTKYQTFRLEEVPVTLTGGGSGEGASFVVFLEISLWHLIGKTKMKFLRTKAND